MKKKAAYKRRNYFIKKGLQSRFIFISSLLVIAGFLANLAVIYYLIDKRLSEEIYRSHIKIETTGDVMGHILLYVNLVAVPLISICVFMVWFFLIRKVTIPLSGFKEAVEGFERGDMLPKRFKGILPELAICYNTAADRIAGKFISFREETAGIGEVLTGMEDITKKRPLSMKEAESLYLSISKRRKNMEDTISIFKV